MRRSGWPWPPGGIDAVHGPAWRQDEAQRVIFHTDRGSTYTANAFTGLCRQLGIRQSMGRVGSCFDNAAAEAFFSSLEWEVLSCNDFTSIDEARRVVLDWCYGFYNRQRRHSTIGMSPVAYETMNSNIDQSGESQAAQPNPPRFGGNHTRTEELASVYERWGFIRWQGRLMYRPPDEPVKRTDSGPLLGS